MKNHSNLIFLYTIFALLMLSISGCTKNTKGIPLVSLGSKEKIADSLTAEVKWTVFEGRKKRSITGLVSIVPNEHYKMEFIGIFHKQMGSFLWRKDSAWALFLNEENQLYTGSPERVSFPIFALEDIPWKPFVDFLWNGLVYQEKLMALKSDSSMDWFLNERTKISYGISKSTGDILIAKKDDYQIMYDHEGSKEKSIPRKVGLFFQDKKQLEINIKKIKWNPNWKLSPFQIKINSKTKIMNI